MKKLIICCAFGLILFLVPCVCFADDDIDLIIEQELGLYDFSAWNYSDEDISFDARSLIKQKASGEDEFKIGSIADFVIQKVKNTLLGKLPMCIALIASAVMSGLCATLVPDDKSSLRELISFISCAMCISLITVMICDTVKGALASADRVCAFSEAAYPVIALLLVASGHGATEAVFSPAMAFLTNSVTAFIRAFVIPIIIAGFVLAIINSFAGKTQIGKLFSLSKSTVKWICGAVTSVFLGAVTIYGIGAKAHDSLVLKTTKYVIDKSVPFAGGLISGSADTVLECFTAIKVSSGVVFMIIAVIIVMQTLFDILGVIFALKITAAVCEPVSDERIPKLLGGVADIAKCLFGVIAIMDTMLIITVALCTCILN